MRNFMTLGICMIVKDEEDVLARCLDSIQETYDELIVVDTGSTDKTVEIAKTYTDKVYTFEWVYDFSAARNYAFSLSECDFLMWLDADDVLDETNRQALKALKNSLTADVDMVMMPYVAAFDEEGKPTLSYERERIVRRTANFSWVGAVHEVIVPRGNVVHSDVSVFHKKIRPAEAGRNLKIFQKMLADGKTPDERQKFYYARELFDNGVYDAAVTAYSEFLNGDGWVENKICACRDLSACFCKKNMPKQALAALFKSFELDSPRAETCCDLGAFYMQHAMYGRAVFWYKLALNLKPDLTTGAFVFADCYGYIPAIQLCVCYDRLGQLQKAQKYNELAGRFKPNNASYLHNKQYFDKILKNKGNEQ